MIAWRFEYGSRSLQVGIESTVLPGIKCRVCGQAWSTISRGIVPCDSHSKEIVKRAGRPLDNISFDRLLASLATINRDARWLEQMPGSIVGDLKVQSKTRIDGYRVLWTIYGPVFFAAKLVTSITESSSGKTHWYRWLSGNQYAEIIPRTLDLVKFGARSLCNSCGRLDYAEVSEDQILEHVARSAEMSFFTLPFGPVFNDTTKLILERVVSPEEAVFAPWKWE
jgi:hypothetical protein